LGAAIISRSAADPIQDIEIGAVASQRHIEARRPSHSFSRAHSPGIAGPLCFLQGGGGRTAKGALADQISPHVGNHPHRADAQRADIGTRLAGSARP